MKILVKRLVNEKYKATDIWRIEILSIVKLDNDKEWGFLSIHKPEEKIGEAVENHLKGLERKKRKHNIK